MEPCLWAMRKAKGAQAALKLLGLGSASLGVCARDISPQWLRAFFSIPSGRAAN